MYLPTIIAQPHFSLIMLCGIEALLTLSLLYYVLRKDPDKTYEDAYILEKVLTAFRIQ